MTIQNPTTGSDASDQIVVDSLHFREGMRHVACAVSIVTTNGPAGPSGFTATAITSVSDSPPTLLVCLNTVGGTYPILQENGHFCVNVLALEQEQVARVFAGQTDLEAARRFEVGSWTFEGGGSPSLQGAVASFRCRLVDQKIVATHAILIGEVASLAASADERPLLYHDRAFKGLD